MAKISESEPNKCQHDPNKPSDPSNDNSMYFEALKEGFIEGIKSPWPYLLGIPAGILIGAYCGI